MEETASMFNWLAIAVAALSSLVVGFIYYHPKVFGTIWMKESGMTPEKAQTSNMAMTMGLTIVLSFIAGVALAGNLQHGGQEFATFQHGAYHGAKTALFLALPILGVNALYEQKSWTYILVNAGYWVCSFAVMGGIISVWK